MKNIKRMSFLALAVTCLAVLVLGVSAASASNAASVSKSLWQFTDGFDGTQASWRCWASVASPFNTCDSLPGGPFAMPPDSVSMTNAWTIAATSGWSDVGRPVSLSPFLAGRTLTCVAQMTVYPIWSSLTGNDFTYQLEVIDSPTWTYVSTKQVHYTAATRPHTAVTITTPAWVPSHKDVFVRIGIIGGNITNQIDELAVDGMILQCGYN